MDSKETYTLAPSKIAAKARQLASTGLYKQALALLERNRVEVYVYPTRVEMKFAYELDGKPTRARWAHGRL